MPYRTEKPIRIYELRSDRAVIAVGLLSIVLPVIALVAVVYGLAGLGPEFMAADPSRWSLLFCLVSIVLIPFASWHRLRYGLVAGGSAQLQLFERSVLVPPAFPGPALAFSFEGLELDVQRFEGRFMSQTMGVAEVLRFRGGGKARSLTSRTFDSPEQLQALVRDIEALSRRAPLPKPFRPQGATGAEPTRDKYDDLLDDALNDLD